MNEEAENGKEDYRMTSDAKLILVVQTLAGREFDTMTLGEIVEMTGLPPATVAAKLQCLGLNHWAEKVGDGYRLSSGIIHLAHKFYQGAREHALRMQRDFLRLTEGETSGNE